VNFTNVSASTIQAQPSTALNGFDTVILYQVCDIGTMPTVVNALNSFASAGGKLIVMDADGCYPNTQIPDYSGFIFPFATSNPGPQGASGGYSTVVASSLTAGLATGPISGDAVGDANVFTTHSGAWCESVAATNVLGTTGFLQSYASTQPGGRGGLVIYDGEDYWFTDGPTNHLAQVFSLMLAQPWNPDSLPCTSPISSGITLTPNQA